MAVGSSSCVPKEKGFAEGANGNFAFENNAGLADRLLEAKVAFPGCTVPIASGN